MTPAWRAFYAGDLDRATALATTALAANPGDTSARLVLARVAMERGDAGAAYTELRRGQQRAPDDPDLLYYLALVSGDLARQTFEDLYKLAPDSARVHQLMAEAFEAQDKRADAEAEYDAALRTDPMLLDALLGLAKLKRIRLACDEAIALYEKAEGIRSTFDGAFGLGTCLAIRQEDEKAIVEFKASAGKRPAGGDRVGRSGDGAGAHGAGRRRHRRARARDRARARHERRVLCAWPGVPQGRQRRTCPGGVRPRTAAAHGGAAMIARVMSPSRCSRPR